LSKASELGNSIIPIAGLHKKRETHRRSGKAAEPARSRLQGCGILGSVIWRIIKKCQRAVAYIFMVLFYPRDIGPEEDKFDTAVGFSTWTQLISQPVTYGAKSTWESTVIHSATQEIPAFCGMQKFIILS